MQKAAENKQAALANPLRWPGSWNPAWFRRALPLDRPVVWKPRCLHSFKPGLPVLWCRLSVEYS